MEFLEAGGARAPADRHVLAPAKYSGTKASGMATRPRRFRQCAKDRALEAGGRIARLHNRGVGKRAPMNQRLEIGSDVAAVLRREESARLEELRALERLRCWVCGEWIEPALSIAASVSISEDGDTVIAEFAHPGCAPSRADLARLVILAQAQPQGIAYRQARHPEAGAVLLWERQLDIRVRGLESGELCLYLDSEWWDGFHVARADEPVRLLSRWRLEPEGSDLVLRRDASIVERFHAGIEEAPPGWLETLRESGFCLLIVGAQLGLDEPGAQAIQRAIRAGHALLGLVEFDDS
jgi:hypothetical protein